MIRNFLYRLVPAILFTVMALIPGKAQVHALLIGVGDYPEGSGWNTLHATNDIALLRTVLEDLGVPSENITTLLDAQATHDQIIGAMQTFSAALPPGATAYFHFSGHGQQIADDNRDELDGLDEALVPYDALKYYQKGVYEGQKHLRDDTIHRLLSDMRRRLGAEGHLMISLDACHSGTGTRGFSRVRGTDVVMADSGYVAQTRQGPTDAFQTEFSTDNTGLASMAALFSAAPNQLSYETCGQEKEVYGLFSYALAQALATAGSSCSYRSLLHRTVLAVGACSSAQSPQLEGNPDMLVLNGKTLLPPSACRVKKRIDNQLVVLDAGALTGFSEGAQVVFYPSEVRDTTGKQPLASGIVDQNTLFDSDVLLEAPLPDGILFDALVWVRAPGALPGQSPVALDLPEGPLKKTLTESLRERQVPTGDEGASLIISLEQSFAAAPALQLFTNGEQLLHTEILSGATLQPDQMDHLAAVIERHHRIAFLRTLDLGDSLLDVRMAITRINGEVLDQQRFRAGDTIRIQLVNTGREAFYFSVLDIMPDNQTVVLIPRNRSPIEYRLEPGQTYLSEFVLILEPPAGMEVLKVFATPVPLDLGALSSEDPATTRGGATTGGTFGPVLARLLGNPDLLPQSRSAAILPGSGAVRSLFFEIIEP